MKIVCNKAYILPKGPFIYYVIKRTGWVGFSEVQYCIYDDIMGGSEIVQNHADV